MAAIGAEVLGVKDVVAKLAAIGKAGKKALRAGVTKAARKLAKGAKSGVVKRTGLLKKSLGQKVTAKKDALIVTAKVGPRKGFRVQTGTISRGPNAGKPRYADPVRYAHLVEKGTAHGRRAQPFLAPAWAGGREEAEAIIAAEAEKAIAKAAKG